MAMNYTKLESKYYPELELFEQRVYVSYECIIFNFFSRSYLVGINVESILLVQAKVPKVGR